jgi:hypothetical protein
MPPISASSHYALSGALLFALSSACTASPSAGGEGTETVATTNAALQVEDGGTPVQPLFSVGPASFSFAFSDVTFLPAGVAAGRQVFFVGDPLDGRVLAYSRLTGAQIGELPQPPGGFVVPFIMHQLSDGRLGVLGAGGVPQIKPFVPANPVIYEYTYTDSVVVPFNASLARLVSFADEVIGFPEDFVRLPDGRELLTDSVLGAIWVVQTDGTVVPGIVPETNDPADAIPTLAFCPTMPEVTVNGVPFLFTGSTIPGIEPITYRNGTVYFHSSCARGIYTFPVAILSDSRQPYQRAADIRLLAATPANIEIEELLEMQFNPYNPDDPYMYAAHGMQLEILRVDSRTGAREVIAHDARLFDFPSSLSFLPPPVGDYNPGLPSLMVVSNQQERTPITNDAVSENSFNLPFPVAEVVVTH